MRKKLAGVEKVICPGINWESLKTPVELPEAPG
jgi:hypothetical protein